MYRAHTILTREQEAKLARKVQDGLQAQTEITSNPDSPRLKLKIRDGKRAETILVEHNVRLITQKVKEATNQHTDDDDLFQDGMQGLLHAIRKFDPTLGYKLSTYAVFWIKQYMRRGMERETLYVPHNVRHLRNALIHKADELRTSLQREPTASELAAAVDANEDDVRNLLASNVVHTDTLESVDDTDIGDLVAANLDLDKLATCLTRLNDDEQWVLKRRFGLEGEPISRQRLADETETPVTVLQKLEQLALAKMRHPAVGLL